MTGRKNRKCKRVNGSKKTTDSGDFLQGFCMEYFHYIFLEKHSIIHTAQEEDYHASEDTQTAGRQSDLLYQR